MTEYFVTTGAVNKQPNIIGRFYKSIKKFLKKKVQHKSNDSTQRRGHRTLSFRTEEDDKGFCLISLTVSDPNSHSRQDR